MSPSIPPGHKGRTPRSIRALLLGCAQAVAWVLLMIVEQLLEQWAGVKHYESDVGPTGWWYGLLVGTLLFVLVLGLTLHGRRQYIKARPLALLLLGWVATAVILFVLFGLWIYIDGGLVIPAAG
ncbi:MAG: hypothetical protein ABI605_15690 [Rhizobacter sp.]